MTLTAKPPALQMWRKDISADVSCDVSVDVSTDVSIDVSADVSILASMLSQFVMTKHILAIAYKLWDLSPSSVFHLETPFQFENVQISLESHASFQIFLIFVTYINKYSIF